MILRGDCLERLKELPDCSVDALVTDPPAGISFMGKDWDGDKGSSSEWIAWMESVMRECLRVMKPGAHGLVWSIPRTSHWTGMALERAGFRVKDTVLHCFGTGFPKSKSCKDIGRPELGSALKPAVEIWWLVQRPLEKGLSISVNVLKWGTGALNIDASRIESESNRPTGLKKDGSRSQKVGNEGWDRPWKNDERANRVVGDGEPTTMLGRFPSNLVLSHSPYCTDDTCDIECAVAMLDANGDSSMLEMPLCGPERTGAGDTFVGKLTESKSGSLSIDGFGSKPTDLFLRDTTFTTGTRTRSITTFQILSASMPEPIGTCIIESAKHISLLTAKSIDSVRVAANGDCSIVLVNEPLAPIMGTAKIVVGKNSACGELQTKNTTESTTENTAARGVKKNAPGPSRFFYVAKASKADKNAGCDMDVSKAVGNRPNSGDATGKFPDHDQRERVGNFHPTVKSTRLMTYLVRMVTPPKGTVLDPFAGSGSTGVAAKQAGFMFIGIEREDEYADIADRRISACTPQN